MIIAIKTDSMDATLVRLEDDGTVLAKDTWQAGRELARDLLSHLNDLVGGDWNAVNGIIVYRGPGSFTSLRIGITTANTIAYALRIPIVGSDGDTWMEDGCRRIMSSETDQQVLPLYGADPHITAPKK